MPLELAKLDSLYRTAYKLYPPVIVWIADRVCRKGEGRYVCTPYMVVENCVS